MAEESYEELVRRVKTIGAGLREYFEETLQEPVPEDFLCIVNGSTVRPAPQPEERRN